MGHAATASSVCVIDDDIVVLEALSLVLGNAGYRVFTAPGAAAGLDIVAREHVDLIVTDMNMPGMGGAQLIAEARGRWPELPIIAIMGAMVIDGRNGADVARELGADACLLKPFRAQDLAQLIETVLAAREAR